METSILRIAAIAAVVVISHITLAFAAAPDYEITENGLDLKNVSPDCPMIYDNDWWCDIPDAAYIWAKASLGECDLRGNIITRCTFDWQHGYVHTMQQQIDDYNKLHSRAQAAGLKNVPDAIFGATEALRPPASGKIEDTKFQRSPGSDLIVKEAHKATPEKPLLVFVGGSCTTIATAYLSDPSIVDTIIVFQIDGGGYNGSDGWAWKIAKERCRFANWARGYFWGDVSTWHPDRFDSLPKNPLCDLLREHANTGLGKANQWGDGPWVFYTFDHRCLTRAEDYDGVAITIPKDGTNVKRMEDEFFKTMCNTAAYAQK